MKKTLGLILSFALIMCFVSCSDDAKENTADSIIESAAPEKTAERLDANSITTAEDLTQQFERLSSENLAANISADDFINAYITYSDLYIIATDLRMLPENIIYFDLHNIFDDIQNDVSNWNLKYTDTLSTLSDDEEKSTAFTDSYDEISKNIYDKNNEFIQWIDNQSTAFDNTRKAVKDEYYSRYGN